jgi:GTP-binding protein
VLNKLDLIPDPTERQERVTAFLDAYGPTERHFEVSAISRDGCQSVVFAIQDILDEEKAAAQAAADAAAAATRELAAESGAEPSEADYDDADADDEYEEDDDDENLNP